MDIEVKKLSSHELGEFVELLRVFEIVFEMEDFTIPDQKHLLSLLQKPDFFTLVAEADGKVIGGLTVYVIHRYYSTRPTAYIYDVGVLPEYQRRGVGKKLMTYLSSYCRENGFEEAYVEAESDDTQAVSFYRTTPFTSELHAIHFTYSFY